MCPANIRDRISQSMTPSAETLADVQNGITALMRHLDGPGDLNPDAPV
jgi:hypothetical protein